MASHYVPGGQQRRGGGPPGRGRPLQPFRRLGGDRASGPRGAGLGLSIARSVAAARAGTVTARPYSEGGLEVTVELPEDTAAS